MNKKQKLLIQLIRDVHAIAGVTTPEQDWRLKALENRAELAHEAELLLDTAESESRTLTVGERDRAERLMERFGELGAAIKRREQAGIGQ